MTDQSTRLFTCPEIRCGCAFTHAIDPLSREPVEIVPVAERDRLERELAEVREALHTICGLSHQDIDWPAGPASWGRLLGRIHKTARNAVEPLALEQQREEPTDG